jgi:hypothetical protein
MAQSKNSAKLQSYLNQAMTAEEHTYASHPTLHARIASAPQQTKLHTAMGIDFYQEFAADEAKLSTSVGDLMCYTAVALKTGLCEEPPHHATPVFKQSSVYLYGSGETAPGAEEVATS